MRKVRLPAGSPADEAQRMCLAIPSKVVERHGDEALVDLQGSSLRVSTVLTPDVAAGDWVLVHAGFAITRLDEQEARQTWDYLRQVLDQSPEHSWEAIGDQGPGIGERRRPAAESAPGSPLADEEPPR